MPLSYASNSGAARICQQGAKARERSDQAGEGVGGGFPPPTVGIFFVVEKLGMKTAFSCTLNAIYFGVDYMKYSIHPLIEGVGGLPPPTGGRFLKIRV